MFANRVFQLAMILTVGSMIATALPLMERSTSNKKPEPLLTYTGDKEGQRWCKIGFCNYTDPPQGKRASSKQKFIRITITRYDPGKNGFVYDSSPKPIASGCVCVLEPTGV